ncbi:glycosyltransferase family 39 protein [Verrucomicrobiales bacterium BCK34]|nr:glycosyltransferase family 39 protein [Verrucomicrobiales bacterium BCK34]
MSSSLSQSPFLSRSIWLVSAVLVARLIYAWFVPVNPAGDEAYYWDWGRQLDYGYYSKPPFIAWLYAFVDWIGQGSLFGIRATAAVLGTTSVLLLYFLTASLFDPKTGWIAVILGLIAPANSVLSFFLTIDAPLVFTWTTALWMLWRNLSGKGGTGTLIVLLFALGIGHLSKQMMMIFPVLTVVYLALNGDTRHHLKRPALLLTLLGSYLFLAPPLIWNAQNDWITFQHTGHHFEVEESDGSMLMTRIGDFFAFFGSQFGVLSPVTAFLVYSLCIPGLFIIRKVAAPIRFCLTFSAIPLAGLLILAMRQELQPNWPAVFYMTAISLTAGWYTGRVTLFKFPLISWRRLLPVTVSVGLFLVLYFYAGPMFFKAIGKPGHKADPERRLMSHDLVADKVEMIRREQPHADALFLAAIGHRDLISHLAFGLPDQPRVYGWHGQDKILSQYDLWPNPEDDGFAGKSGLIVHWGATAELPAKVAKAFTSVKKLEEFTVPFGYATERTYTVFRGDNLKSWPENGSK